MSKTKNSEVSFTGSLGCLFLIALFMLAIFSPIILIVWLIVK